jgi:Arc/MetJ-type ribon-helix-helix transcriptional regulator
MAMTIELPLNLAEQVNRKVESGEFATPLEVVCDALEGQAESEVAWMTREELRQVIAVGVEQARRGELIPAEEVFRELDELNAQAAAK